VSLPKDTAGHPEPVPPAGPATAPARVSLATVLREWGRIGCIGFGGPPTHIKLLRELCVERKKWIDPREFEDAIAACNLLPGPASTQLAIFGAWRTRGRPGGRRAGGLVAARRELAGPRAHRALGSLPAGRGRPRPPRPGNGWRWSCSAAA